MMRINTIIVSAALLIGGARSLAAQTQKIWTPQELFERNVGTRERQEKQRGFTFTDIKIVLGTFTSVRQEQLKAAR